MAENETGLQASTRRAALGRIGSLGIAGLFGCGGDGAASGTASTSTGGSTTGSGSTGSAGSCAIIPQETEGPYPLLAILSNAAVVRKNITEGKPGLPLNLTITLQNTNADCAPIVGAAVYIWHCDKNGEYSGYSSNQNGSHAGETYLRGIQVSDANGQVAFTTIYPGWYAGRITHIHMQVYLNDKLTVTATATTQFAFPQDATTAVYNSSQYVSHGQNTSVTSFAADNVFSDGTAYQMLSLSGDAASGYDATISVGIAV